MAERLLRDMHPVEVFAPKHGMAAPREARVFVTDAHVQVWVDEGGAPKMLFETTLSERVEPERGSLFGQLIIETASGQVFVTKGKGCGCHSPLKALMAPAGW